MAAQAVFIHQAHRQISLQKAEETQPWLQPCLP